MPTWHSTPDSNARPHGHGETSGNFLLGSQARSGMLTRSQTYTGIPERQGNTACAVQGSKARKFQIRITESNNIL